jgi:hypothetical protein
MIQFVFGGLVRISTDLAGKFGATAVGSSGEAVALGFLDGIVPVESSGETAPLGFLDGIVPVDSSGATVALGLFDGTAPVDSSGDTVAAGVSEGGGVCSKHSLAILRAFRQSELTTASILGS